MVQVKSKFLYIFIIRYFYTVKENIKIYRIKYKLVPCTNLYPVAERIEGKWKKKSL